MPFGRSISIFAAGSATGVLGSYLAYLKGTQEGEIAYLRAMNAGYEAKLRKSEQAAVERVRTPKQTANLMGLMPKIWLEALNEKHIYTTVVYAYWQRWELSGSSKNFSDWMQRGGGSRIDLPHMPRRLIDEWQVQYLSHKEKKNFLVHIENGLFVWSVDGTPCNVPAKAYPAPPNATAREKAVAQIVEKQVLLSLKRDKVLAEARERVELAIREGKDPFPPTLRSILNPCIEEGLLISLRDPSYEERIRPREVPSGHPDREQSEKRCKDIPMQLLPGLGWDDVLKAIDHDEGIYMKESKDEPLERRIDELEHPKGIFVLDKFGDWLVASKVRGVLHHSSLCNGHAVRCAGAMIIENGVLKQLSAHSGHFRPLQEDFDALICRLKAQGVDFTHVKVKSRIKVKQV